MLCLSWGASALEVRGQPLLGLGQELRLVPPSAQLEGRSMLDPTPESVQARVRGRHARALVKAELRVHPISQRLARGEVEHSALVAVGLDGRAAQRAGMTRLVPNLTENFPRGLRSLHELLEIGVEPLQEVPPAPARLRLLQERRDRVGRAVSCP